MKIKDIIGFGDTRACCGQIDVPTDVELKALNAMRNIKDKVRDLKKGLSEISSSGTDGNAQKTEELEKEISRLKAAWMAWEKERENAARQRMIRLGHEEEIY